MNRLEQIEKNRSLLRLARDYAVTAMNHAQEALACAQIMETLEDPELLMQYNAKVESLLEKTQEAEKIALQIEKTYKKNERAYKKINCK